jgi:hypothetical protein
MSNKLKKSHIRGSKDLPAFTATASEQGANQQVVAEKITVEGEAKKVCEHNDKADADNIGKAHADTDSQERQQIDSLPEQEAEIVLAEVKQELRGLFVKSDELIKRLGNALKKIVKRERDICEEIKTALKEEIAEGIISTRTIELHCRPEWRREWKRKTKSESEKNSLSRPQSMAVAKTQDGKSVTEHENEVGNDLDMSPPQYEQGVSASHYTPTSKPSPAALAQQEQTIYPQPDPSIGIGSVGQTVCEHCPAKDAKIMELEEALNLKAIYSRIGNDIKASSAHTSYNRFDNSELSEEEKEREDHKKCKNCKILQQKYEQLQSKVQGYEEVVRTHTSIKTAKELFCRSTDGYQQFEFFVPFESLRQHMIASFNSNRSMNRVWFTGKINHETGEVIDVQIGKITDTNTTEIKQESKTSVILNDTLDDITGD